MRKLLTLIFAHPLPILLFIGITVRLSFFIDTDFPINDGGMFYTLVQDILANNFHLPLYSTYNHAGIPFAYPPLAFYLIAVLHKATSLPVIPFFRLIPLISVILSVPVFYALSLQLFRPRTAFFSTLVFTLLPRSFEWLIMGGGVARAPGLLFALLTLRFYLKIPHSPTLRSLLPTSLFLSFTLLTHLEWAVFAGYSLLILDLLTLRRPFSLRRLLLLTAPPLLLTSPWWLLVLSHHGLVPFLSFSSSGLLNTPTILLQLSTLKFTDEPFLTLLGVLGLLGLLICLSRKNWWLPLWFVFPLIFIPRSSPNLTSVPLSLLAGLFLSRTIYPLTRRSLPATAFLILLFAYLLVSNFTLRHLTNYYYFNTLSLSDRQAMNWVAKHSSPQDRFLVVSPHPGWAWGMDAVSEWFPALTDRVSIATPQGTEWLGKSRFLRQVRLYTAFKDCYSQDLLCLENTARDFPQSFTHIYDSGPVPLLEYQLRTSPNYHLIYNQLGVAIYQKGATPYP